MRYSQIRDMDISNGEGIAVSLFTQGCTHHCKGCFNPETWDFNCGKDFTKEVEYKFIELCKKPYISCVSILGGEPFDQDEHIYWFLRRIKFEIDKPIYLWSGYKYEHLLSHTDVPRDCLLEGLIDYLIDGKFEEDKRDLTLKLRGSTNQRVIDVKESIKEDKIVLKCD